MNAFHEKKFHYITPKKSATPLHLVKNHYISMVYLYRILFLNPLHFFKIRYTATFLTKLQDKNNPQCIDT